MQDKEKIECDYCHIEKIEDDFRSPGHRAGSSRYGYDIDSCCCAECAKKSYEDFQNDLYETALAEMANEQTAGVVVAEGGKDV